jgi:hypothetical protein
VTAVVAARPRRPRRPPQRSASPVGSALRLTLSERATLAITIRRAGTRAGSPVGTLVRASVGPGAVTIAFSGRIGKIALGPGSYVASVTAIDGAGNRSGSSALRFTIVSR